jgi:CRISPR system Cascade subunit CasD
MNVLLLRLVGPMQSWGVQSRFPSRDTGLEPSKSGVTGLLCAALGYARDHPIEDLAALKMGVRVDSQGSVRHDYQTALDVRLADAQTLKRRDSTRSSTSKRQYLADARFLVGLEGDDLALLQHLHAALRDPHWPLYLGRKAFVPGEPVWLPDGLRADETLLQALKAYPWLGPPWREPDDQLRLMLEDPDGPQVRRDQPISFADRRFAPRHVRTTFVQTPAERKEDVVCTSPD